MCRSPICSLHQRLLIVFLSDAKSNKRAKPLSQITNIAVYFFLWRFETGASGSCNIPVIRRSAGTSLFCKQAERERLIKSNQERSIGSIRQPRAVCAQTQMLIEHRGTLPDGVARKKVQIWRIFLIYFARAARPRPWTLESLNYSSRYNHWIRSSLWCCCWRWVILRHRITFGHILKDIQTFWSVSIEVWTILLQQWNSAIHFSFNYKLL